MPLGLFTGIGPWEAVIILAVVLIVFGVGRLPQVGSALGKGLRQFRSSASREDDGPPAKSTQAPEEDDEKD